MARFDNILKAVGRTHIVHPDGNRVIPFDTYNMLYRDNLEHSVLEPIRRERQSRWLDGPLTSAAGKNALRLSTGHASGTSAPEANE
jgi:hypothetical protein